jgi:hypothetical protein
VTQGCIEVVLCACRHVGLASTLTKAFSQQGVMQQPDLQRNLLELLVLLDKANSIGQFTHDAGVGDNVQLTSAAATTASIAQHGPVVSPAGVNSLLNWSLRSGQCRQLPQGVMALVAEADAAQERTSKAALRTEARLAALQGAEQGSLLEGLRLLGGGFGQVAAAASNIQLLVGSPLGTGLKTLSSGHPGASAGLSSQQQPLGDPTWQSGLLQQLSRPASAPSRSPASTTTWMTQGSATNSSARRYHSPQPGLASSSWSPAAVTAAGAAAVARDKLHMEKLHSILGSPGAVHAPSDRLTWPSTGLSVQTDCTDSRCSSSSNHQLPVRAVGRRYLQQNMLPCLVHFSGGQQPYFSGTIQAQPPPVPARYLAAAAGPGRRYQGAGGSSWLTSSELAASSQSAESLAGGWDTCACCGSPMSSCCGCSCDVVDHQPDSGDCMKQTMGWSRIPGTADTAPDDGTEQVCFHSRTCCFFFLFFQLLVFPSSTCVLMLPPDHRQCAPAASPLRVRCLP